LPGIRQVHHRARLLLAAFTVIDRLPGSSDVFPGPGVGRKIMTFGRRNRIICSADAPYIPAGSALEEDLASVFGVFAAPCGLLPPWSRLFLVGRACHIYPRMSLQRINAPRPNLTKQNPTRPARLRIFAVLIIQTRLFSRERRGRWKRSINKTDYFEVYSAGGEERLVPPSRSK